MWGGYVTGSGLFVMVGAVLLVVLFAVVGTLLLAISGRRYRFYGGRVQGAFGEVGTGKSMFVVGKILRPAAKALASRRGLHCVHTGRRVTRIITNFDFDPTVWGYHGVEVIKIQPTRERGFWHQLLELSYVDEQGNTRLDAVIGLDEAGLFHPSDEMIFDPLAKLTLTHIRKANAEFFFMATDHMLVHKRLRKFARTFWMMREDEYVLGTFTPWRWFVAEECRRDDNGNPLRPAIGRRRFRFTRKLTRAYNSYETIVSDFDELREFESLAKQLSAHAAPEADNMRNAATPDFARPGIAAFSSDGHGSSSPAE